MGVGTSRGADEEAGTMLSVDLKRWLVNGRVEAAVRVKREALEYRRSPEAASVTARSIVCDDSRRPPDSGGSRDVTRR